VTGADRSPSSRRDSPPPFPPLFQDAFLRTSAPFTGRRKWAFFFFSPPSYQGNGLVISFFLKNGGERRPAAVKRVMTRLPSFSFRDLAFRSSSFPFCGSRRTCAADGSDFGSSPSPDRRNVFSSFLPFLARRARGCAARGAEAPVIFSDRSSFLAPSGKRQRLSPPEKRPLFSPFLTVAGEILFSPSPLLVPI